MKRLNILFLIIVLIQQANSMDYKISFNSDSSKALKIEQLRQLSLEKLAALHPEKVEDQVILGSYLLNLLIGNSYYQETNQEYNIEIFLLAEKWLLEAKNKKNAQALYDCARLYIIKKDFVKASEVAREGIEQHVYELYPLLIDIYKQTNDNKKAFNLCAEALLIFDKHPEYAKYKNRVNNELAFFYENGLGCDKNIEKAIELYRLTASNGSVKGKFLLASLYLQVNQYIKQDMHAAKKLLISIAQNAYSLEELTYYVLGVASLGGIYQLEQNILQAEKTYKLIEQYSGKYYLANLVLIGKCQVLRKMQNIY